MDILQDHEIYAKLKSAILSLTIKPGEILQESSVGQRFGVSRTPAREALRTLMDEGLITKSGRFYQAKKFSAEEVRLIYEVREALECQAGRLATQRASDEELRALRGYLEKHFAYAKSTAMEWMTDGTHFHHRLAQLSGNPLLSHQLGLIFDKVTIFSRIEEHDYRETLLLALEDHFRIVDAMIRRNPIIVEEEIRQHIRLSLNIYKDHATRFASASDTPNHDDVSG